MEYNFEVIKERIEKELKDLNSDKKASQKANAISGFVAKSLIEFSKSESFGERLMNSEKTLTECCNEIMKNTNTYISDNAVYTKAAQFYMPNSVVNFIMEINTDVMDPQNESVINIHNFGVVKTETKKIEISLDDLL